jgi:L-fuconolactonase
MIVDTHVHVWDLKQAKYPWLENDTSLLNSSWHIGALEADRKDIGITSGVLIQASSNYEDTDWMFETAAETKWIKGVVAWLPLMDSVATKKKLEEDYINRKYFKGIRHQVHDEKDAKWLLQPTVIDSLKILAARDIPYDFVGVLPAHIETVLEIADKVPELRIVFDHLNQPPILKKEKFGRWGELMKEAAKHKNFYAKISGLGTTSGNFQNWHANDLKPYIEFVLEYFGTDHCFCGGDWPVALLAGSYKRIWEAYRDIIEELTTNKEQEKILYHNAVKFYSLEEDKES